MCVEKSRSVVAARWMQGPGGGKVRGREGGSANGYKVSSGADENALELDW